MTDSRRRGWAITLGAAATLTGVSRCSVRPGGTDSARAATDTLHVMVAASLAQPMRAVLDSFSAATGTAYTLEPGASLEVARLVVDAQRRPDVVVLADPAIFARMLEPTFVRGYQLVARNRIVLAYTDRSAGARTITADNWPEVITRPGVQVGRADPNTDPSGYRALLVMRLAERFYHEPGLYERLLAAAPPRNVRPREADQVALLQTHNLDYIWTYQNLAEDHALRYVKLPDAIDLGSPGDSVGYAHASIRVLGRDAGDTLTIRGAPILFGGAVLRSARHWALGQRFLTFLMSATGRRIAGGRHLEVLDSAIVVPAVRGPFPDTAPAHG